MRAIATTATTAMIQPDELSSATEESVAAPTVSMSRLNRIPAELARRYQAHAATDITGFGLVGHALGLARESGVGLEIETHALPLLPGALMLAEDSQSGGLKANRRQFADKVDQDGKIDPALVTLAYDPQTSGGLLLSVPETRARALLLELKDSRGIGRVVATNPGRIALLA